MSLELIPFGNGANVLVLVQSVVKDPATWALATSGAVKTFQGRVQNVSDDVNYHDADLTPMDSFLDNPVPYGFTGSYSITEFESPIIGFSVLKVVRKVSLYAAIAVQQGSFVSGVWTPTIQDVAVVKFNQSGLNASRESAMRSATFQLVQYATVSTGAYATNPIVNDVSALSAPFGLIAF